MAQLIQIRTNTNFDLNYENGLLEPCIELILLFSSPKYEVDKKKTGIVKTISVSEFRVKTDSKGIAELIGQLQATQVAAQTVDNMSAAFNHIIKSSKDSK